MYQFRNLKYVIFGSILAIGLFFLNGRQKVSGVSDFPSLGNLQAENPSPGKVAVHSAREIKDESVQDSKKTLGGDKARYVFDHGLIGFAKESSDLSQIKKTFAPRSVSDIALVSLDYSDTLYYFKENKPFKISVNGQKEHIFLPKRVVEDENGVQIMISELSHEPDDPKRVKEQLLLVFSNQKLLSASMRIDGEAYALSRRGQSLILAKVAPDFKVD